MDNLLFWANILVLFCCILLGTLTIYLLIIGKKSGKKLVKINSTGTISLFFTSGVCFISSIFLFYNDNKISNLISITSLMLIIFSIYCLTQGLVQRNSISEKGIIVFSPFPHILKWDNIKSFQINRKQIYLKKQTGYSSIDILNRDTKVIEDVILSKLDEPNRM